MFSFPTLQLYPTTMYVSQAQDKSETVMYIALCSYRRNLSKY